jgi:hypothetical protein
VTLCTSDTSIRRWQMFKSAAIFLVISLFCSFFNYIYGRYSHGVSSRSMTLMFLYSLVGGTFICLLIGFITSLKMPGRLVVNLFNSGLSTLIMGSLLKGIFDIAGTSSPYQPLFTVAGWLLVSLALVAYLAAYHKPALKKT